MKTTLIIFLLVSSVFAQDMNSNSKLQTSHQVPTSLQAILMSDKTDENLYVDRKYVCHNFASQFYLQNSCLVPGMQEFDLPAITREWGTVISRLEGTQKLPLYYVALSNRESGFYHAINAYLVNPDKPGEIESYLFIEPQTDEVMFSAKDLYNEYKSYYDKSGEEEVLHISIGTFDGYKSNGAIYQSLNSSLQDFDIKFK